MILLVNTSCNQNKPTPSSVKIERLDLAIEQYKDMTESNRAEVIDSFAPAIEALRVLYPVSDESLLQKLSDSQGTKIFTPDIRRRLPSLDSIETSLGYIRSDLATKLPEVRFPRLVAIVSTFNQSIINVDSIMLIGLNHYLGKDYPGYGYFETYQRFTKTPQHLPYDILESIILNSYPYRPANDATTLNRLLYEGAIIASMMQLIPDATITEALGYTPTQLQWLSDNERQAWQALITRQYLYSTDEVISERLVNPAPSSTILHPESPGRAGRYIGYRIVASFLAKNPDTSLDKILSPQFYNSPTTLISASYNP